MVSNAVANWAPTAEELDEITSFAEYEELLKRNGSEIADVNDVLAGSFKKSEKKDLAGVPFVVLSWREQVDEKTARSFAFVQVMTSDNRKLWFTDGSTGVFDQLQKMRELGVTHGILVKNGLRRSDYTFEDDKGKPQSATTYYLDVS